MRLCIFSALGDFSENQKEKLSRVKEEVAIFSVKKVRRKAEHVGREVHARLWNLGEELFLNN